MDVRNCAWTAERQNEDETVWEKGEGKGALNKKNTCAGKGLFVCVCVFACVRVIRWVDGSGEKKEARRRLIQKIYYLFIFLSFVAILPFYIYKNI
jgi:hypothetical protein